MTTAEFDPNGIPATAPGAKLDGEKPRPELIIRGFVRAIMAVTKVSTFGADKYTDDGWQEVPDGIRRYTDALYRHMLKYHLGEWTDPESNLPHLAHAAWNALAILELSLRAREGQDA